MNDWLEEWEAGEKRQREEAEAKLEEGGWAIVKRSGKVRWLVDACFSAAGFPWSRFGVGLMQGCCCFGVG